MNPTTSLFDSIAIAVRLHEQGLIDRALDVVYDSIDDVFWVRQFEEIDQLLQNSSIASLPTDLLLGVLVNTRCGHTKLPSRAAFCDAARVTLLSRGESAEELLRNLVC